MDAQNLAGRVEELVQDDPRISQRRTTAVVEHPETTVQRVLALRKRCTQWMPGYLSALRQRHQVTCARENLTLRQAR